MWFKGPITEAIGKAKSSQVILIVFVRHATSTDDSDKMESFWTDEEIADQCEKAGVVPLKLLEDSESARQFAQIYPVPVVPCSFLIGRNGVPLDIITMTDNLMRDSFSAKVRNAIQTHATSLLDTQPPPTNQLPSTSTTKSVENAPTVTSSPSKEEVLSKEAKVERAKQLLAEKRAADEEKAKAEEREKELKRREEGKAMRDAQQQLQDRELREAAKQRRLEKQENDAALKRLREQIAADRADKQAQRVQRSAPQGDAVPSSPVNDQPAPPSAPSVEQQIASQAARSDVARIQCRFADGTNLVLTFTPEDVLQQVVTLIEEDGRQPGNFYLVQMYPRREFTAEELGQSFRQLGLAPSAVLVVVPESGRLAPSRSDGKGAASSGGVTGVLSALFAAVTTPLFSAYHLLLSLLGFGNPNPPAVRAAPSNNANQSPRPAPPGNVHRFRGGDAEEKDDDDMGTWNGNSTQQL